MNCETASDNKVSADIPDWSRERCRGFWDPGRRLLRSIRRYQKWHLREIPWHWNAKYWVLQHRFWSVITGADIPLSCELGGGLILMHPNGVVIFPGAVIGPNCLIFQQVTIGTGGAKPGAPVLGGHVDVGAGAKILGGVKIWEPCSDWGERRRPSGRPSGSYRGRRPRENLEPT
jgi:serine O-acetyltransferase